MNFSEVLRVSGGGPGGAGVAWSPDGRLVAWPAAPARLEVRDTATLQVLVTFTCVDAIQEVEWAPDSCYLLTACYKRGKVEEGAAGLVKARWAPDSRHILTTAEFYLQISIWSLVNKSIAYIRQPKGVPQGVSFSPGGEYLVVAERREGKDSLSLFETTSWQIVKNFPVCTKNLAGVLWAGSITSPSTATTSTPSAMTGGVLAVWDSPLQYLVALYSMSGHCMARFSAYEMALGVWDVGWAPSGQFLAITSFDNKIRLLNHLTWGVVAEFPHTTTITTTSSTSTSSATVYREAKTPLTGYPATLACARGLPTPLTSVAYHEETSRPITLATQPSQPPAQAPRSPPALAFSRDGRYLATRRWDMPGVVWVWDVGRVCLKAVLVQEEAVKDMAWDPRHTRLALCTGGPHLYLWTPLGTVAVTVPHAPHLCVSALRWHPFGRSLILNGKTHLSVCFLDPPRAPLQPPRPPQDSQG